MAEANRGPWIIAVAIVAAAALVGGVILFVTRDPDPCDKWNDDMRMLLNRVEGIIAEQPGTVPQEELDEIMAEFREISASAPEDDDCEVDEDVLDQMQNIRDFNDLS
jgi:hypothetical protein